MALKFGFFIGILCLPAFLPGQPGAGVIHPPALGFVFDSGTLKPLLGIPGASLLGAPLDTGFDPADIVVSPRQDYALLLARDDRTVNLLRLPASGARPFPIDGALSAPDRMILSPTGTAAVLYRAGDGLLQVLTSLPASPRILREIPCATLGALTSVAIADDGQMVLAAGAANLVLIPSDGIPRPVQLAGPISAVAFRPRTYDAIVAGRNNQISLLLHAADVPQIQSLAGPDDGIAEPLTVEFSLDGLRAFVANSAGKLVQLDLAGAPPQALSCQCRITGLHRLAGNSVFRLTDPSDGPLIVFDGDTPQARMLFVPAASEGGANGVQ